MFKNVRGEAVLIFGLVFWALEAVLRKPIITDVSPWFIVQITSFGVFIVSFLISLPYRKELLPALKNNFFWIFISALLGILGFWGFYVSLGLMDASVAGFIKKIEPVFVMIFGYMLLGEVVKKKQIPFMLLAFVGMFLVSQGGLNLNLKMGSKPLVMISLAAAAWGAATVTAKKVMSNNVRAEVFLPLRFGVQSLLLFPIYFLPSLMWTKDSAAYSVSPFWVIVFTTFLTSFGFLFYYIGLQKLSAIKIAFMEFLSPIIMLALSFMILGERFNSFQWFGVAIIFFSVYFLLDLPHARKKTSEE